ncbi:DUF1054 domain-containing protein [Paenibacillus sp. GSMTC-2017]|uniref:DUF1054 domain-containing protein n=1 Tax=Paenibacillus sp. GSMTC-2017 TaxID=2794350 RepID=UPI0018D94212|nr:DUF1054 domain-containing protein [Paenibacillus sp. GSMTC-2017]MBH5316811.1 DUF1054 domain-containing protein [Paenibacillus sp. GSMTC-2017]
MTTTVQTQTSALPGFHSSDFDVFGLQGLEERMAGIQTHIRPKFQAIGEQLTMELSLLSGNEMFLHIAKHARRTVNPPKDTWLAICNNKRGYKAHPHFQLGLFDDHLFIWFALIYEAPNKKAIATAFLNELDQVISSVPSDYSLSQDHMKKQCAKVAEMDRQDWESSLKRFRDVQKAELLIGRQIAADDKLLQNGDALLEFTVSTYKQLFPLYQLACSRTNL